MIGVCSMKRHALILFCIAIHCAVNMVKMAGMDLELHAMEILTSPEAARYIGVHERTLAAMRSRGDGPQFTRMYQCGRGVRYQRTDLDAWLSGRSAAA